MLIVAYKPRVRDVCCTLSLFLFLLFFVLQYKPNSKKKIEFLDSM